MWLKVCGMTTAAAVDAALALKLDAIGFVFAPSVRRVAPAQAAALAAPARGRLTCVAVTLHPTQTEMDEILQVFKPDVLQTDVGDYDRLQLPPSLPRLPVLRAAGAAAEMTLPARLLFEGLHSGAGTTADWDAAKAVSGRTQLILAGGLHAQNVAAAIGTVHPFGVDVSSGVESRPGVKSAEKMAEFAAAARAASAGVN
jgi:phosphoribosylanthranilate isomerase